VEGIAVVRDVSQQCTTLMGSVTIMCVGGKYYSVAGNKLLMLKFLLQVYQSPL